MGHRKSFSSARRRALSQQLELIGGREMWGELAHPECTSDQANVANELYGVVYRDGSVRQLSRRAELIIHNTAQRIVEAQIETKGYVS